MFGLAAGLLLCFCSIMHACPPVDLPQMASMNCSWVRNGVKQCRFECEKDAKLIGPAQVTCRRGAETWNSPTPICYNDDSKCGRGKTKKKCTKITDELLQKVNEFKKFFTSAEKDAIRNIRQAYKGSRIRRGKPKCYTWMCSVQCPMLNKKGLVKFCRSCKKKSLKCNKNGSLFG